MERCTDAGTRPAAAPANRSTHQRSALLKGLFSPFLSVCGKHFSKQSAKVRYLPSLCILSEHFQKNERNKNIILFRWAICPPS
jgi:hypothetical protein